MKTDDMTLRDAIALEWFIHNGCLPSEWDSNDSARQSFAYADAWLAERDKSKPQDQATDQAIPDECPRTADGKPIYIGMTVFAKFPSHAPDAIARDVRIINSELRESIYTFDLVSGNDIWFCPKECYSTHDASEEKP